jgi:hypothetical protein
MAEDQTINLNPRLYISGADSFRKIRTTLWGDEQPQDLDMAENDEREDIDEQEIFGEPNTYSYTRCPYKSYICLWQHNTIDLIRSITDPERAETIENLGVVSKKQVCLSGNNIFVEIRPSMYHCGMAAQIGGVLIF